MLYVHILIDDEIPHHEINVSQFYYSTSITGLLRIFVKHSKNSLESGILHLKLNSIILVN